MEKVSFLGSKITLQFLSMNEYLLASQCTRKLLRLFCKQKWFEEVFQSDIRLIYELPKQCLIITKSFFLRVSDCFCPWRVCNSFWKEVGHVAHLHSAVRGLSSPSRCFQLSTNLDKDCFCCLLCWVATTIFTKQQKAITIKCVTF